MQLFARVFRQLRNSNGRAVLTTEQIHSKENEKFIDLLKENYTKTVEEADMFSKRFTQTCADVNTEFLYGWLNVIQHYVDIQEKYAEENPVWYIPNIANSIVKKNTEAWIQSIQNMDSVSIEGLKNLKNSMKTINKNAILFLQSVDRTSTIYANSDLSKT